MRTGLWAIGSLVLLSPALMLIGLGLYEIGAWAFETDGDRLAEVCGRCHEPTIVRAYGKSPDEWSRTVDRMLAKGQGAGAGVSADDRQSIKELLVRRRSSSPALAFRLRCGRCHAASVVDDYRDLSDAAFALLVSRHVYENNFAIYTWEGDLAAEAIRERFARLPRLPAGTSPETEVLFEDKCNICHTITFRYRSMFVPRRSDDQWAAVIQRMREKTPDAIGEDDVFALVEHVVRMRDTGAIAP